MNRRHFMQSIAATAALPLVGNTKGLPTGNPDSLPATHAIQPWFHRDGLGLFLHWGPASVGEIEISWGMFESHGSKPNPYWPVDKYFALADRFDPQNFNPDMWMEAAAKAGFKYVVYITRHCDGYALWPSAYGDFSTRQKLKGRDLVRPYVKACRKHGLKVGFYYSPTDWHYAPPGWPYRGFPRRDPEFHHAQPRKLGLPQYVDMPTSELQKYFEQFYAYVKGQVTELLTNYGEIDVLWWDGYDWPDEVDLHGEEMQQYCRQLQPKILLNDRYVSWHGKRHLGDFNTELEAKDPKNRPPGVWEQCEQICVGWSYRGADAPCRPASHLIERLARDRAWGGNYLPDFGPRADGTLSPEHYAICEEMATWMKHSRASVIDVEAGPYPDGSDVPVTRKGNVWYLHFLSPTQLTATLSGVQPPKGARLLRTGEKVSWKHDGDRVALTLPGKPATDLDEVVEVKW